MEQNQSSEGANNQDFQYAHAVTSQAKVLSTSLSVQACSAFPRPGTVFSLDVAPELSYYSIWQQGTSDHYKTKHSTNISGGLPKCLSCGPGTTVGQA